MSTLALSFAPGRRDDTRIDILVRAGRQERRISFCATVPLAENGDALAALGLLPAIELGVPLVIAADVSQQLSRTLPDIQTLLCSWHPNCRPVPVSWQGTARRKRSATTAGVFFSGGADSFYTLVETGKRAGALITLIGADIAPDNQAGRARLESLARRVAKARGIAPIIIGTDLRRVSDPMIGWDDYHGCVLAAAAHLLSGTISTGIVAASADAVAWRYPWGSSPLLDPLWSSEAVALEHHGCLPRTEKFARLKECALAMDNLRVCYESAEGENCGRCAKCTYARLALEALGVEQGPFPPAPPDMNALRVTDMASETKHAALARLARENGRDDIAAATERALAAYRRRAARGRILPVATLKRRVKQIKRRARLKAGRLI